MTNVHETLKWFRSNSVPDEPPTNNARFAFENFPGGRDNPQDPIIAYDLNVLFKKFEAINRYNEIEFLVDCFVTNRVDEVDVCLYLSRHNRLDTIIRVIGLLKENRMWEFYTFKDMLRYGLDQAIRYLNIIFRQATTINDLHLDASRLNAILSYSGNAGLNFIQQQEINKKYADSVVDVHKDEQIALNKAKADLAKERSEHDEEIRFAKEKADTLTTTGFNPFSQGSVTEIDFFALEKDFIVVNHLVRVQYGDDLEVSRWDVATSRYVMLNSTKTLTDLATSYIYKKCGTRVDFSASDVDKMVNRVKYATAPLLGEPAAPKISNEMQVFFSNGYYDLKAQCFCPVDTTFYFHMFSMPFPYQESINEPVIFESILMRTFEGDKRKIKLAYQIIGAIISHVMLKYMFVFQGVTHGGKSTLMECIRRLFYQDETKSVGSMREISDGKGFRTEKKVRLLCIDDAPNEKWNDNVVSYLKTRSKGTSEKGLAPFKILLNTNYPITMKTADGRDESIDTRIIVLPFSKNMREDVDYDSQFIRDHFENQYEEERPAIVKKALEAFAEVLQNNETFAAQFPLNEVVSVANNAPMAVSSVERESLLFRIVNENFGFVDIDQFLAEPKMGMLAKHVYNYINGGRANLIARPAELSKQLKNLFAKQFASREYADKTYFNLRLKD